LCWFLSIYIFTYLFISGVLIKGKWRNLRDNFRREHAKISKTTTGSAAPDDSPLSAWKYYKQLLFLVDMFSSRKLQTNIPSVPSQAYEPADDTDKEDEYVTAGDSIIDADLGARDTSSETQEAEVEGAAQKDSPAGPSMKQLKKPNIQMQRKTLKSDAINQLLSLEKRKIEHFEKMHERRKTSEEFETDEDYHFLMSLLPHLHDVPKRKKLAIRTRIQQVLMEEDMKHVVPSPTTTGSYDHYQSYSTIPSPNATQGSPTPASYSLTAYPSEPALCVLTAPTTFQQSMNQFSNSNNS